MPKEVKCHIHNKSPYHKEESSEDEMNASTSQTSPIITGAELLKEASRIRSFSGNEDYDLSSFIREVDTILEMFRENPSLKTFVVQRYVLTKINGAALNVIRPLGNSPTWEAAKDELIRNFGVKENYRNLYHQAINIKNFNVSEYFYKLRDLLDKANIKYEFDKEKPIAFSPEANETFFLKTFLDGISPHLSSIVLSRNITKLRDAFYILEDTGMIRPYGNNNNFKKFNRHDNYTEQSTTYQNNKNPQNNANRNNYQSRQYNNSNTAHNYNNSSQIRQNPRSYRQESGNFRQQSQQTRSTNQTRFERPVPMEIDHIQQNEEVNFQLEAQNQGYR